MWPVLRRPPGISSRTAPHHQFVPIPAAALRSGLFAGEPATCRRDLRQFLPILAHLGLLLLACRVYRVEGRGFQFLLLLAAARFRSITCPRYRWKKPIFLAASIGGLGWVFGPEVALAVVLRRPPS